MSRLRYFLLFGTLVLLVGVQIAIVVTKTFDIVPPFISQPDLKEESVAASSKARQTLLQSTTTAKSMAPEKRRELTFDDLEIGKFVGNGAINLVAHVQLPDWWKQQPQQTKYDSFVVKLAAGGWWRISQGIRECEVLDRLSEHKRLATKHNIVPALVCFRGIRNPFRFSNATIPPSFPEKYQKRLRKEPKLVAIIVPYLKLDKPSSWVEDLADIRVFIKSLLKILEYSHSMGINNFDLSQSNVKINNDGKAVVLDWNANKEQGQEIYDETANTWITAPEGLVEREDILQTSVSAMDIWGVGVMLANMVYGPSDCSLVNLRSVGAHPSQKKRRKEFPRNYELLRTMVLDIGGETRIPISKRKTMDLAPILDLNRTDVLNRQFQLPLYSAKGVYVRCPLDQEYEMLKGATQLEREMLVSFLQTAMKISPAERPQATDLLRHPFLAPRTTKFSTEESEEDADDEESEEDGGDSEESESQEINTNDHPSMEAEEESNDNAESSVDLAELLANVPHSLRAGSNETVATGRELTFDDLKLGKFIGNGAINIVSRVHLPQWWYEQHNITTKQKFAIKMAAGDSWYTDQGDRECEVLEILASSNRTEALEHNIIPAVSCFRSFPNSLRNASKHYIPKSFPTHYAKRLRKAENLVAIVVPYLDLDYTQRIKTFQGIRVFIRSLLQVLEYSHSMGINNFDLSDSNVYMDDYGKAVVMDWNANKKQEQEIFDSTANLWVTAPEGMIEHGPNGEIIRQTSISAMDVWSLGIMLVSLAYRPCSWVNPVVQAKRPTYPRNYNLLRETVRSVGGETRIPIGGNQTLDLASLLDVNRTEILEKEFEMPLFQKEVKCDFHNTTFRRLEGATEQDLDQMHSFLKSVMKISPAERPDASTLLQHQFMKF
eukprot:scaffold874_cov126-Cylindrotheca_fusiformis.AAC.11